MKPADLVVVLAPDDDGSRLKAALTLLDNGITPQILVDADNSHVRFGMTAADRLRSELAARKPLAAHVRVCPVYADSTRDETRDVAHCLRGLSVNNVLIVTSAFHTRRALATFTRALPQYHWSVTPVDEPDKFRVAWWRHRRWASTTWHEWEKLAWWEFIERWVT